jgi:hypothetical protein
MTCPELRESRSALILIALSVVSVLGYGAFTWMTQLE